MIKKILLIVLIIKINLTFSQSWEDNYYDSEILYENAELLQLTEHEINLIKIKNIEKEFQSSRDLSAETFQGNVDFFVDFENENLNSINIQNVNGPSFQEIAESIESKTLSENIIEENL